MVLSRPEGVIDEIAEPVATQFHYHQRESL